MQIAIVIHKEERTDYGVTVPDIPGCFSSGSTMESAIENAKEAILFHVTGLLEDGEPIDFDFREIDELKKIDRYSDGTFVLVDVDIDPSNLENHSLDLAIKNAKPMFE